MGDPKRHRKKYSTPSHPWQKERIEEERVLKQEYGFRNKREIWKMSAFLKDAAYQAKKLVTLTGPQADKERDLLLNRMKRYGVLPADAGIDAILSISLRDILERRLQTLVYKHNLANSVNQARQFITHEHITVKGNVITSPSYLVTLSEEPSIAFRPNSAMVNEDHPERVAARKAKEALAKEKIIEGEGKGAPESKDKKPKKETNKETNKETKKKPAAKKQADDTPTEDLDLDEDNEDQ